MTLFGDYPYWLNALFAAFRIILWFFLLFGFIAPVLLSYTRKLPLVEKIIYSWVGMGGILIFWVFALAEMHLYDLISIILILCLNPLIYNFFRTHNVLDIFSSLKRWELKTLVRYIRLLEKKDWSFGNWLKIKVIQDSKLSWRDFRKISFIGSIALVGTGIRMIPVLQNAAPLSSGWFVHLDRVKNIRLQEYTGTFPEPGGMHALVSAFSLFTQVSPELILHLLGGITSFFLCIIVYWAARDITKNKYPVAIIAGMAIYALTPLLLMPVSFDQQIDAGSLDLALCFAFPTMALFIRNLRNRYKSPWFYPFIGFTATAMVNLYVAFLILLPMMFLGLGTLPRKNYLYSLSRTVLFLLTVSFVNILPYIIFCYYYGIEIQQFLLRQLYNTSVYSYFPSLIWPLERLSSVYMLLAAAVASYHLIRWFQRKEKIRDELTLSIIFLITSSLYILGIEANSYLWFDIDQLNSYYALLIAIFISVLFSTLLELIESVFKISSSNLRIFSWGAIVLTISGLIFLQGGLKVNRATPDTIPNGFMKAYYDIIAERQPYSYATVGPKVQEIMAKNRNYFMEYSFFLEEYRRIDSLYHQQLQLPKVERDGDKIPPASVFVFTDNAPNKSIQQGILYNSSSVMHDLEQWIANYRALPNRRVKVFYSDKTTTVYELVNRRGESNIDDLLFDVYPPN